MKNELTADYWSL